MITKGEIQSINLLSNTCVVRMPLFESAGIKDAVVASATFSNLPGGYAGFKEGDVVWVAFEDGQMQLPVVIGKLFLGVDKENKIPRGAINCETLSVKDSVTLPFNTKIDISSSNNIVTGYDNFSSLISVFNAINNNTRDIEKIKASVSNYDGNEQVVGNWFGKPIYRVVLELLGTELSDTRWKIGTLSTQVSHITTISNTALVKKTEKLYYKTYPANAFDIEIECETGDIYLTIDVSLVDFIGIEKFWLTIDYVK